MAERENSMEAAAERLLEAALPHVAFDGWSEATLRAAMADSGTAEGLAHALYPRGGVDLAVAYHRRGDAGMRAALAAEDLSALRFRDRIARAVTLRLARSERELVRRGSALFALPQHAVEGAGLIWGTADAIWTALGDTARDLDWYTKRASLSAVYGATVLFWLGDGDDGTATAEFLDRRIENVMAFEKAKAGLRDSPLGKALATPLERLRGAVRPPAGTEDMPGHSGN